MLRRAFLKLAGAAFLALATRLPELAPSAPSLHDLTAAKIAALRDYFRLQVEQIVWFPTRHEDNLFRITGVQRVSAGLDEQIA